MGPNYNRGMNPGCYPKSPQQLQAEIESALNQYRETFNTYRTTAPPAYISPNGGTRRSGEYVEVADYQEMENADTRLDGVPTLFVDFKNRVFWSKKWVNGGHSVQAFHFEPIIGAPVSSEQQDPIDYVEDLNEKPEDKSEERLQNLEKTMGSLQEMMAKLLEKEEQRGNKRSNKGAEHDLRSETGAGDGA